LLKDAPKLVRKAWKGVDLPQVKSSQLASLVQKGDPIAMMLVDDAARSLGGEAAASFRRGQERDFQEVLAEAISFAGGSRRGGPASALTRRQAAVARLVAQGLSNREIAGALSVAPGTAKRHVEDIMTRLGVQRRAQIAAWAVQHPEP